uniref:Ribonuclease n=1 Tax=Psammophis mossambicus TaxID=234064 RepID=I0BWS9_PSAMO|nr:ribonuclease [Psammophis mossambicus]
MASKGIHLLCLLFSLAWIVLETEADNYGTLKKKHWDYPRTTPPKGVSYCNYMMKSRRINYLRFNIFIHASEHQLKNICPKYDDGEWTTDNPFSITTCTGHVDDYSTTRSTIMIVVFCRKGLPIEFRALAP